MDCEFFCNTACAIKKLCDPSSMMIFADITLGKSIAMQLNSTQANKLQIIFWKNL